MLTPPDLPLGLSLLLVILLLIGSIAVFIGTIGLMRFHNFYDRLHMPALGTTTGVASILLATAIYSSYQTGHLVVQDILILLFITYAAPISLMMVTRAATMRDFTKSWRDMSHNMFWKLAQNKMVKKTDTQVDQELALENKEQQKAEIRQQAQIAKAHKKPQTLTQAGEHAITMAAIKASARNPKLLQKNSPSQKKRKAKLRLKTKKPY